MIEVLNENFGMKVNVSDESHYMGALGAALFAMDHIKTSRVPAGGGIMSYVVGVDVGSTYTKVVVLSPEKEVVGKSNGTNRF